MPVSYRTQLARLLLMLSLMTIFAAYDTFFTVSEGQAVVVVRLGRPVRQITNPGLYWKLPSPIDSARRIDLRRQVFTTNELTTLTRDKKNIALTSYVVWHVDDPLLFLQSLGDPAQAREHLTGMALAANNTQIGQRNLGSLLRVGKSDTATSDIERSIQLQMDQSSRNRLGIAIDQVGIERLSFPPENLPAVLERMRAERHAEANRLRTEGAKLAQVIRDEAHVRSQEILRAGKEEASRIQADAERAAGEIRISAFQQNPEFYRFWNALETSRNVLNENATLVLSSEQFPFAALVVPTDRVRSETSQSDRQGAAFTP